MLAEKFHGIEALDQETYHQCVRGWHSCGKISDCQPESPGFNPRPGRGLNFGRPSFATPSVDRDVKPLSLNILSGDLK